MRSMNVHIKKIEAEDGEELPAQTNSIVGEVIIMGDYLQGLNETLVMVVSSFFSIAIGLPLGIVLVLTHPDGIASGRDCIE